MYIAGSRRNYITVINDSAILSYDEAHELTQQNLLCNF
jgi:hypothetical protein